MMMSNDNHQQQQDEDATASMDDIDETNSQQQQDTSSSDGKGGGGSGVGGYSADCSSSDTSSDKGNDAVDAVSEKSQASSDGLSQNDNSEEEGSGNDDDGDDGDRKPPAKKSPISRPLSQPLPRRDDDPSHTTGSSKYYSSYHSSHHEPRMKQAPQLAQWNGIRIQHPMDPRIDLSTVGYAAAMHANIPSCSPPSSQMMLKFPPMAFASLAQNASSTKNTKNDAASARTNETGEPPPPMFPSFEQYMKLMESVRPFFHAHGISNERAIHQAMGSDEPNSSERTSSELPTGSSDSDQRPSVADLVDTTRNMAQNWSLHHHDLAMNATNAAVAARNDEPKNDQASPPAKDEVGETDSSSMVVLARPKRKHQERAAEGPGFNESSLSNSTSNSGGSNTSNSGSSATSSEKRVRIQQPQHAEHPEALRAGNALNQEAGEDVSNEQDGAQPMEEDDVGEDQPEGPNDPNQAERQEGNSSGSSGSSSEDRNNAEIAEGDNGFEFPAVVSEYSSSNRNSSGASNGNGNPLSTSGSGSGGNTASGSGSNQGGSSGGGISSNGTGSSGSGNDAKGSSEEMVDNSGENNSGENNSDTSNKAKTGLAAAAAANPGDPLHHHPHHHSKAPPNEHHDQGVEDAAREKKIQDKKRKRMNMRREYEEKLQESSDASRDREVIIRPGRPVTLDKVLSFTKTPRLVVKAGPPLLVVYTNASYSRLSGVDSHNAVGKPINTLLSLPDQNELSQLDFDNAEHQVDGGTTSVAPAAAAPNQHEGTDAAQARTDDSQNHAAAEAAGRARAAATSREHGIEIGLEPLIAASGYGKIHITNVRANRHNMVGRNVKVITTTPVKRNQDEGSNAGSSITSSPQHYIPCTMSISPVVSSPDAYSTAVVTDRERSEEHHHHKHKRDENDQEAGHHHKAKRKKHYHHQHGEDVPQQHPFRGKQSHLITHYCIQLEPFDGKNHLGAMGSQSSASTAVEARKAEVRRQRMITAAQQGSNSNDGGTQDEDGDDVEMESEVSEAQQPHVSAIG